MDWMMLLNQILDIILPAAASLVAVWFGILGSKMKATYIEEINSSTKKNVAKTTVEYIEQVYKNIHGQEKLNKAIEMASSILNEKGISVSETELKTLLESAVYGLEQGWRGNDTFEVTTPIGFQQISEDQNEEA